MIREIKKFSKQRIKRGFDDSETWALDNTVTSFIYPRLKRFVKLAPDVCRPGNLTIDEWKTILDRMLGSFRELSKAGYTNLVKKVDKGLKLFFKYYDRLWW